MLIETYKKRYDREMPLRRSEMSFITSLDAMPSLGIDNLAFYNNSFTTFLKWCLWRQLDKEKLRNFYQLIAALENPWKKRLLHLLAISLKP